MGRSRPHQGTARPAGQSKPGPMRLKDSMPRTLAAWTGCLLMLSASWASAAPPVPGTLGAADTTDVASPVSSDTGLMGTLPDLGRPANAMVTPTDDYQIGQMELIEIRNANLLLEDPETDDYLQQLGMRLASQAHDDGQDFHYRALRSDELNSFATFGGNVYIFTDLILETQDEAELASVMAHETGHVVQHHMARDVLAESHMSLASTAAMLAAIAIGAASGGRGNTGEGMEGALAMAQATAMQRSINFTRSEEIEADYVGIQLLAAAGYDPYEMADFFDDMCTRRGTGGRGVPAAAGSPGDLRAHRRRARARGAVSAAPVLPGVGQLCLHQGARARAGRRPWSARGAVLRAAAQPPTADAGRALWRGAASDPEWQRRGGQAGRRHAARPARPAIPN